MKASKAKPKLNSSTSDSSENSVPTRFGQPLDQDTEKVFTEIALENLRFLCESRGMTEERAKELRENFVAGFKVSDCVIPIDSLGDDDAQN